VTLRVPNPPSALRRYQVPWSWNRSLGQSLSHLQDWVLPVMQRVHRPSAFYDGRLPDRHIWRHPLLAASTARTSAVAMELLGSAGSGKHCCRLRWHPLTAVSTGRHLRSDSSAAGVPLPVGMCLWSDACGNTVSSCFPTVTTLTTAALATEILEDILPSIFPQSSLLHCYLMLLHSV
jgi:hypothetical protein